jgi:hypothetical protein
MTGAENEFNKRKNAPVSIYKKILNRVFATVLIFISKRCTCNYLQKLVSFNLGRKNLGVLKKITEKGFYEKI